MPPSHLSSGEGDGTPLQYSCLENPMDGGAWSAAVHGVSKSCSDKTERLNSWVSLVAQTVKNPHAMQETWVRSLGWEDLLEKETETHSSTLAWKIPWTEEPGDRKSVV